MNHQRLLEHFSERILSLGFDGITADDIHWPNVEWTRNDRNLWFEITIAEGEPVNHAEGVDRRLVTVNVICAVPLGAGTQRLNNVAEKVSKLYTPLDSKRAGFTVGENILVLRRVTKYPAEAFSDGLKLNVRFVMEKYAKEC